MTPTNDPFHTVIPEVSNKHPGLTQIHDLMRPHPWGMGLIGLIKWLAWQTESILGKTKTTITKQAISVACETLGADAAQTKRALDAFEAIYQKELETSAPKEQYSPTTSNHFLHPFETTRRLRYFSEDLLNKEFDIFFSLLPTTLIHAYLARFFHIQPGGSWAVFGNSNDFEFSTDIQFMQIDTLAYNPEHRTFAALELKIDAEVGEQQVFKYALLTAALEARQHILPHTQLKLLILGNQDDPQQQHAHSLRQIALSQLEQKLYPKRGLSKEDAALYHPRCKAILEDMELRFATWQDLGDFFAQQRLAIPRDGFNESCFKLIDGFLASLATRYSRKQQRNLYTPAPSNITTQPSTP